MFGSKMNSGFIIDVFNDLLVLFQCLVIYVRVLLEEPESEHRAGATAHPNWTILNSSVNITYLKHIIKNKLE